MTSPRRALTADPLEDVRESDSYLCRKRQQDGTIQFCAALRSAEKDLLLNVIIRRNWYQMKDTLCTFTRVRRGARLALLGFLRREGRARASVEFLFLPIFLISPPVSRAGDQNGNLGLTLIHSEV